jgi:FMN phosphatase YigB (HAD superfamily)
MASVVRSFDVFDTVLTRRIGDPHAMADLIARRLELSGTSRTPVAGVALAAARRRHERRLIDLTDRHPTLRAIWAEVASALGVDDAQAEAWACAEEELEREVTVAVPGAHAMLEAARAEAGGRVVFVSDTPHSEAVVRDLLEAQGLAQDDDLVFTSSERGATKSRGGLFEVVTAVLGAGPGTSYVHTGDNRRSDLASPRLEGWEGRLVTGGALTRYESLLEKHATASGGLTSWLAGSSRLARLEAAERGVGTPVGAVAAGVLGPVLVGFALWVLGQARARGVRRLYFVARDGEVMLAAAREVLSELAPDVELRYLHGSRQPWVLGACATSEPILAHWAQGRADFTARTTIERTGLGVAQVHEATGFAAAAPGRADTPLTAAERAELAGLLQAEPLVSLVREAAAGSAARTTAYLRQEGLLDGTPSALVDAGWSGRAAAALDQLLVAAGGQPVPHLFVGLLGSAAETDVRRGVTLVPWLFDRQRLPGSTAGLHDPHVLVEMLCAGTEGRTVDYETGPDGVVRPVLDRPHNDAVLRWGLRDVQEVAVRTAALVAPHLTTADVHTDTAAWARDVLSAFWIHPTPGEAEAWGSFPGEEEIWPPLLPLAQRLTGREMAGRLARGERSLRRNNSWRAGSALASSQPWRGLLQAKAWSEEARPRARRLPRRVRLAVAARRGAGRRRTY